MIKIPFPKQEVRSLFNGYIEQIERNINHYSLGNSNSMMTYIIYKLIKDKYNVQSWEIMSNALKVLEDVKLEFFNNVMKPYSEKKIEENGDV